MGRISAIAPVPAYATSSPHRRAVTAEATPSAVSADPAEASVATVTAGATLAAEGLIRRAAGFAADPPVTAWCASPAVAAVTAATAHGAAGAARSRRAVDGDATGAAHAPGRAESTVAAFATVAPESRTGGLGPTRSADSAGLSSESAVSAGAADLSGVGGVGSVGRGLHRWRQAAIDAVDAGRTDATRSTGSAVAPKPRIAAVAARAAGAAVDHARAAAAASTARPKHSSAVAAVATGHASAAGAAGTAVTPPSGAGAVTPDATGPRAAGDPAGPAGSTRTAPRSSGAASAPCRSRTPCSTRTTRADETRRPAGTAGLSDSARTAVATIAPQQPPSTAGLTRAGSPVCPIANQWPPEECLRGCIHHIQESLFDCQQRWNGRSLGTGIGFRAGRKPLNQLIMEHLRMCAHRPVRECVVAEQRRDHGRHLVTSGRI